MRKILTALLVCSLALGALIGCGGGSATSGTTRSVNVFVTDSFRDDYEQVWGTVYKIEVVNGTSSATLFEDNAGKVFDFKTLRDSSGARFAFLNRAVASSGPWNQMRVTVGDTMDCVPTGGTTATTFTIVGDAPASGGKVTVTRNFPSPRPLASNENLVFDFDLANFVIAGSNITPSIIEGSGNGADDLNRHEEDDISGTVASLSGTAPDLSFDLQTSPNRFLRVRTNSATTYINRSGEPSPTLSINKRVEVRGKFDVGQSALIASTVKIEDVSGGNDDAELKGIMTEFNLGTGDITVTPVRVQGFRPTQNSLTISTDPSTTRFLDDSGVAMTAEEFFATLALDVTMVEAEGSYDGDSNTLTANKVKIEREGSSTATSVEAKCRVATKNATSGVITANVDEFEGWIFGGGILEIRTNGDTVYQDANRQTITKAAYFEAISATTPIEVKGRVIDGNTITATRLRLDD